MNPHHLTYNLHSRAIDHWLTLGPAVTPVTLPREAGEDAATCYARFLAATDHVTCDFPQPPQEPVLQESDKVERFGGPLFWEVEHCREDHLIEKDVTAAVCSHARAWAFTRLTCGGATSVTLRLAICCSASVWLNGQHVIYCERVAAPDDQAALTHTFAVDLRPDSNDLLVRLEQVAAGSIVLAMAADVDGPSEQDVQISVPTITQDPVLRQEWERALEHVHLDRAVYQREDLVTLLCDDEIGEACAGSVRLQQPDGVIYAWMDVAFEAGARLEGLIGAQLAAGRMEALLTPRIEDYYSQGFRARRSLPFSVNTGVYVTEAAEDTDDRLIATVKQAARGSNPLYAELAKMAMGWWAVVDPRGVRYAIDRVRRYEAGCLDDLLGLAAMLLRVGGHSQFPADLLPELRDCLAVFDFEALRKGAPASCLAIDLAVESNQITLYAAQIVVGQILWRWQTPTRQRADGAAGADPGREAGRDLAAPPWSDRLRALELALRAHRHGAGAAG